MAKKIILTILLIPATIVVWIFVTILSSPNTPLSIYTLPALLGYNFIWAFPLSLLISVFLLYLIWSNKKAQQDSSHSSKLKAQQVNSHSSNIKKVENNSYLYRPLFLVAFIILLLIGLGYIFNNEGEGINETSQEKLDNAIIDNNIDQEALNYPITRNADSTTILNFQDLSNLYNYKLFINGKLIQYRENYSKFEPENVKIEIINKNSKIIEQTIKFNSDDDGVSIVYVDYNEDDGRSYITGKNKNSEIPDGNYGSIIIADFNFDGIEDFAIKSNSGGNGGPFYRFYVNNNGAFILDYFLTKEVGHFPDGFDQKKKTITLYTRSSVSSHTERIYKYDSITQSWQLVLKKIHEYNDLQVSNESNDNNKFNDNENSAEIVVKSFFTYLGNGKFYDAYNLTKVPYWEKSGGYNWFSSTKAYGGISSISIYDIKNISINNNSAIIFIDYYSHDSYNTSNRWKQNIYLEKKYGTWKIVKLKTL